MKALEVEEFLDWIVAMDLAHYKTETFSDYNPAGASHFYIKRSSERFTSAELIKIYTGKSNKKLTERWNWALSDIKR
jgi:hypothetical protein